ncbi:MAG: hypothetical protein ACIAQF_11050 [Phycisphaerales bacterium JB065]
MNKRKRKQSKIRLLNFPIISASAVEWPEIEAAEDGKKKLPRFHMNLYNGGPMVLRHYAFPVIVDFKGLTWTRALSRPALRDHDPSKIVGHTTKIWIEGNKLLVDGVVSAANEHAEEVALSGRNGFPWRTSMGASPLEMGFVPEGQKRRVNGGVWKGPFYHSIKTSLYEASFVALGADDKTSAQIAAQMVAATESEHGMNKEFRKWLQAHGYKDPEGLSEMQLIPLEAAYESETGKSASIEASDDIDGDGDGIETEQTETPKLGKKGGKGRQVSGTNTRRLSTINASQIVDEEDDDTGTDHIADLRAQMADEVVRAEKIKNIPGITPDIAAKAIKEGWDLDKTELTVIRARQSAGLAPFVHSGKDKSKINEKALTAALCISAGMSVEQLEKDRDFEEEDIEAAMTDYPDMGLQEVMHRCLNASGEYVPYRDKNAIFEASGFTTNPVSSIIGNSMNKMLLSGYESVPIVAPTLCKKRPVKDFKPHTTHRLLASGQWDKVGSNGQLRHGEMSEQSFSVQADTYGRLMVLDRQTVINDDLGAFMQIPEDMGRDAANKVDIEFFNMLLEQTSSFFKAANGNVLTGAGSGLDIAGLTAAHTKFRKMKAGPGNKEKDKRPINIVPKYLVVPVELEVPANSLMTESRLITGESKTQTANNPHVKRYTVVATPHLSDEYFSSASAEKYYLFADPNRLAAFYIAWLRGRDRPHIENVTSRQDPSFLEGMAWRGYSDFGFGFGDPKAALRADGTATVE